MDIKFLQSFKFGLIKYQMQKRPSEPNRSLLNGKVWVGRKFSEKALMQKIVGKLDMWKD